MLITDTRTLPLARLRLYGKGSEPIVTDRGYTWHAILAYEAQFGTSETDADGQSLLAFTPGVGLVCRGFPALKDTRSNDWLLSAGSWEERRPATGSPRVYRLVQYDTTAGLTWEATSKFNLPADPSFAVTLALAETPADWDATTDPQYCRLEFGNDGTVAWAIHLDRNGTYILRDEGAGYVVAAEVSGGVRAFSGTEVEEQGIAVQVLRGRLGVSLDGGRSYAWATRSDPRIAVAVPAAPLTISGQGGLCVFGLHQLKYWEGDFTSRAANTLTSRATTPTVTTTQYYAPAGTSITLADASTPLSGIAQWRATLTPDGNSQSVPFEFWSTPELYALDFEYPVVRVGGSGYWEEPFDGTVGDLLRASVTKPFDLDQGHCSLDVRLHPDSDFAWSSGRYPLIQLWLGHQYEDGSEALIPVFTGYVLEPCLRHPEHRTVTLRFQAESLTTRFKGNNRWSKWNRPFFGGMTVNTALDRILYSEGLWDEFFPGVEDFSRYRLWHNAGLLPLDPGLAEEPSELVHPPAGETKWDTIRRLCGFAGVEFGVSDDGFYITIPKNHTLGLGVNPVLTQLWEDVPATELTNFIQDLEYRLLSGESATAVEVYGQAPTGEEVLAYAVNVRAERFPAAHDWSPWRETIIEELDGTVTPGMILARAQAIAGEAFPLKFEADVTTPVRLGISRRDQGQVTGEDVVGINSVHCFVVLGLTHEYNKTLAECKTQAGLRLLLL